MIFTNIQPVKNGWGPASVIAILTAMITFSPGSTAQMPPAEFLQCAAQVDAACLALGTPAQLYPVCGEDSEICPNYPNPPGLSGQLPGVVAFRYNCLFPDLQIPGMPIRGEPLEICSYTTDNPTFSISSPHFEQVVEDPQLSSNAPMMVFDAVQGKSASFKMTINAFNLSTTGMVTVKVSDPTGNSVSSNPIATSAFTNGSYTVTPDQFPVSYIPTTSGSTQMTITVVPQTGFQAMSMPYTSMSLNVHQVTAPSIGFIQVNGTGNCPSQTSTGCIADPSTADFQALFGTNQYVSRVFPVPDNSVTYSNVSQPISATSGQIFSITSDLLYLEVKARLLGLNRLVGVVSENYFQYHSGEADTIGYTLHIPFNAVLVSNYQNNLQVVAHELAHTYGVPQEDYIDDPGQPDDGDYNNTPVNGFDATTDTSYLFNPAGAILDQVWSFMGPPRPESGLPDSLTYSQQYWADNATYTNILNSLPQTSPDPQVLLVSGILTESGKFMFSSSVELQDGTLTPSVPNGDVTISSLDANNQILSSVSMQSDFNAYITYKAGSVAGAPIVDVGSMPIVLALPSNSNISSIQVAQNGKVIQKAALNSQLLQGIISSIPDSAFRSLHKNLRDRGHDKDEQISNYALRDRERLNKLVTRIQTLLNSREPVRAIDPLRDLIREIKSMTFENYTLADASELTQSQAVGDIETIIRDLKVKLYFDQDDGSKHDK